MKKLSPLAEEFFANGKVADCPIYDLHGHAGPYSRLRIITDDAPSMIRSMDRTGVKLLAFCHHSPLFSPEIGNAPNIEFARYNPDRLKAYCGINPNYPDLAEEDVSTFDQYRDVYIGFKMLASYHKQPLTADAYAPAWKKADKDGLLVLVHTWAGDPHCGPQQVRLVAEKYPNAKILIGHCFHNDWASAISISKDFPNTYLDLCAVMDERGVLERFVNKLGSERITFGTDFPWFDQHYYIGAVLGADIDDESRRNIFYRNAEKLLASITSGSLSS